MEATTGAPSTTPPPPGTSAPPSPLFQPGAWAAEDWSITPQLTLASGYNDNLRLQSSAPIASPFVALFPSLTVARSAGDDRYQLSWRTEWTRFTRSRVDSTTNTELATEGLALLDPQTALAWRLAWQDWHDSVGQSAPDQPIDAADHFRAMALGAVWRHDAGDQAQHRVELEPTLSRKRYQNHLWFTERANADTGSLVARYLHSVAPAQRAGGELRVVRTLFPSGDEALSNTDWRAMATVQWDPTDTFNGSARAGWERRRFDSLRPTYSGVTWEADLHWQARPASLLDLTTSRVAADAPGEGADEAIIRRVSLAWTEAWSPRSRSTVTLSDTRNRYVNAAYPRDDHLRSLDLGWRVDLDRRWQFGLNWGWAQRRSSVSEFDFARRLASVVLSTGI